MEALWGPGPPQCFRSSLRRHPLDRGADRLLVGHITSRRQPIAAIFHIPERRPRYCVRIATEVTASPRTKDAIADRLAAARRRTLALLEPLDDEQLNRVYSPLLSPLAWDLGHIANFEELWLVRTIGEREPLHGDLGRFYDAIENPRRSRGELPILRDAELRSYLGEVRERTLEVLDEVEIDADAPDRLLRDGFVYEMLIAHELQHNETMLQLLMMVDGYRLPDGVVDERRGPNTGASEAGPGGEGEAHRGGAATGRGDHGQGRVDLGTIAIDGGEHEIGAPPAGFAYDNERPRHTVELDPFEIDRCPVTNGAFVAYMEDAGAEPPLHWERDGASGWLDARMGRRDAIDPAAAVIHVSWHEADAFARWAGKRLPTELEWEAALASPEPDPADAPSPGDRYGHRIDGASPEAAPGLPLLGHAWEWTSSHFRAYPGFEAFPYREYSEAFFGDEHRVLRGGSWATAAELMRPSFRNWDLPQRRQIFAGFRCARSAGAR
jgi:gamma-glutamyl hercynylcysteine S-oxide synthase